MQNKTHSCLNGQLSDSDSWWEYDTRGIPLSRVCHKCRTSKLSKYRPEILHSYNGKGSYDETDVDERIEEDY